MIQAIENHHVMISYDQSILGELRPPKLKFKELQLSLINERACVNGISSIFNPPLERVRRSEMEAKTKEHSLNFKSNLLLLFRMELYCFPKVL